MRRRDRGDPWFRAIMILATTAITAVFIVRASNFTDKIGFTGVGVAILAFLVSAPGGRADETLVLLRRIADKVAPVESGPMVRPGNWFVELDDGGGAERSTEIDGAARLAPGDELPGLMYGRRWRIARVNPDIHHAVAVPFDDLVADREEVDGGEVEADEPA